MTLLRQGKYFRIPERPGDVEQMLRESEPINPAGLPPWIAPEEAGNYRFVGTSSFRALSPSDQACRSEEIELLEGAGLIVHQDPANADVHEIYIPTASAYDTWSIGIYAGKSPLSFAPMQHVENPVLSREDVSDVTAVLVADPFMIHVHGTWFMFFEVLNWKTNKGEIGLATSEDGLNWVYQQIVLDEPFHLSYPHVFEWSGRYYLIPESYQAGSVRLYEATEFPLQWSFVMTLVEGSYFVDASAFRYGDKWWLFVGGGAEDRQDTLCLYYSDDLLGPWQQHPGSPVVKGNPHIARPAGRVVVVGDRIIRYAQNCHPSYGREVRAFIITDLSTATYQEREFEANPVLGPSNSGWNAGGMHHVDPHCIDGQRWIACVDGWLASSPLQGPLDSASV